MRGYLRGILRGIFGVFERYMGGLRGVSEIFGEVFGLVFRIVFGKVFGMVFRIVFGEVFGMVFVEVFPNILSILQPTFSALFTLKHQIINTKQLTPNN